MNSNAIRKIALESPDIIWFVARASTLKGPFTTEQLQTKLKSRDISYLDFCWRQGFREWRPIGSIEDFDQRSRLKSLPAYPMVEVPSGVNGGLTTIDSSLTPEEIKPQGPRKVEVSFARSKRRSISIYEWGMAIVFSVVLSFFATDFALLTVQRAFLKHMRLATLGEVETLGDAQAAMPPMVWNPLFSAPSFLDVAQDHVSSTEAPVLMMAVEVQGFLHSANGTQSVGDWHIQRPLGTPVSTWDPKDFDLDPIYVKPVMIKGYLPARAPLNVDLLLPGDPSHF